MAAVVDELRLFVGAKVQAIRQPDALEVNFELYLNGRQGTVLLSCDAVFFRAHFITRRTGTINPPPQFVGALRARLEGSRLASVEQIQGDRIVRFSFDTEDGRYFLIAELMGKHSNLMLVDPSHKVAGAAKWVGRSKSSRSILPGVAYELPPVMSGAGRQSRFFTDLIAAGGDPSKRQAVFSPHYGAYPIRVSPLGLPEIARDSISIALEQHYGLAMPEQAANSLRAGLLGQLDRVILAREAALHDLRQAEDAGGKAPIWQRYGELILTYGSGSDSREELIAWDYDGTEVRINIDPELDFKANAARYFDRAKRAKARLGNVRDQAQRLSTELDAVIDLRARVEGEERLEGLEDLRGEARKRRWLSEQHQTAAKEDRPYGGHRIRELLGPGGFTVLVGENAESNDYLTLRVARSNDYWFHVRGGTSAHVVIQTRNRPERVQPETLSYAAKIAVQHSPSKHAGYVAVDYTLKKHVRKPKGAPKGTALYTHEKTIHVDS